MDDPSVYGSVDPNVFKFSTFTEDDGLLDVVILDNRVMSSIFGREDLLDGIIDRESVSYKGIGSGSFTCTKNGYFFKTLPGRLLSSSSDQYTVMIPVGKIGGYTAYS